MSEELEAGAYEAPNLVVAGTLHGNTLIRNKGLGGTPDGDYLHLHIFPHRRFVEHSLS
jgi:hypothetical protein